MDGVELAFLNGLKPTNRPPSLLDRRMPPPPLDDDDLEIVLHEWALTQFAPNNVAKLVRVARFHRKLDPIWNGLECGRQRARLVNRFSIARAVLFCLRFCCGGDLIKFHVGRKNPFTLFDFTCRCGDDKAQQVVLDPEPGVTNLNERTVDENYQELCRFLVGVIRLRCFCQKFSALKICVCCDQGKDVDDRELSYLRHSVPAVRPDRGPTPNPITLNVFGAGDRHLPEWSEMRPGRDSVVKLLLALRFYRKLHPIWYRLDKQQKTKQQLRRAYQSTRAALFCQKVCCGRDLIQFHEQWGNPFRHAHFSTESCSAGVSSPMQCGYSHRLALAASPAEKH